jgi:hypothetical protein
MARPGAQLRSGAGGAGGGGIERAQTLTDFSTAAEAIVSFASGPRSRRSAVFSHSPPLAPQDGGDYVGNMRCPI